MVAIPVDLENELARRWLKIQRDLGLAQNNVEAYGRGLEEYLRFVHASGMPAKDVGGELIATYVRHLRAKSGATRGKVISIATEPSLSYLHCGIRAINLPRVGTGGW